MKIRIVVLFTVVVGLVGLQGCCGGGEWFPEPDKLDKPVRKQLPQDKTNRSESGLPGLIVGVLNDIVN